MGIRERLSAIYALYEGATTEHEREAVKRKLDLLCEKYNIDLETLFKPETRSFSFSYNDKYERDILFQVIFKVKNTSQPLNYWKGSKRITVDITEEQATNIRLLYDVYRVAWKQELDLLLVAFLNKHNIFPDEADQGVSEPLTPERIAYLKRLRAVFDTLLPVADPRSFGYLGDGGE